MKRWAMRWRWHIMCAFGVVVYAVVDLTLAAGFLIGLALGLGLSDEMRERADERYERSKRS